MFTPKFIYYEPKAKEYELGKRLLSDYEEKGVKLIPIENHNNIEALRKNPNSEFANMKQNIIIGVRKTHNFVPNHKVSDFLVPYTSSRLYCNVHVLLFSM